MSLNADRILERMNYFHLSYQQLADLTGISKSTLHRYSHGVIKVPADRLWSLAFALSTTPQYLMNLTDDPSPSVLSQSFDSTQNKDPLQELVSSLCSLSPSQLQSVSAFISYLKKEESLYAPSQERAAQAAR